MVLTPEVVVPSPSSEQPPPVKSSCPVSNGCSDDFLYRTRDVNFLTVTPLKQSPLGQALILLSVYPLDKPLVLLADAWGMNE